MSAEAEIFVDCPACKHAMHVKAPTPIPELPPGARLLRIALGAVIVLLGVASDRV